MKKPIYEFVQEFSIPLDEILVRVEWNVSPGYPATGPSYSCGGEPGAPAEVEDVSVTITPTEVKRIIAMIEDDLESFISNDTLMDEAREQDPEY